MQILNRLIPGFEEKANLAEDIDSFCSPVCLYTSLLAGPDVIKLQTGANDARSDDTSRLKVAIAEWLNERGEPNTRLSAKVKSERGLSNDLTGRLLCPIDYDWDNPECVIHFSPPA
jgi:hypothetical protein